MPHQRIPAKKLRAPFGDELGEKIHPVLSPAELAELLGLKVKTIYIWIADGRLDGCFRKRGKHILILRDAAIEQIFNGPTWRNEKENNQKNPSRESNSDLPEGQEKDLRRRFSSQESAPPEIAKDDD
jgi:excisionase family DNA binding protein